MRSATCIEAIPMSLMVEALDAGFFEGPPKWKHADDTHPTFCMLVIDDCLSLPMMMNPSSGLVNTCIKHRHIADGLGMSIAMLVQTYCAVGGLPRPIRENCTLLCLFKLKDQNQLKKIHEEIGSDVDLERFDKLFEYATSKPYGFLAIDFSLCFTFQCVTNRTSISANRRLDTGVERCNCLRMQEEVMQWVPRFRFQMLMRRLGSLDAR